MNYKIHTEHYTVCIIENKRTITNNSNKSHHNQVLVYIFERSASCRYLSSVTAVSTSISTKVFYIGFFFSFEAPSSDFSYYVHNGETCETSGVCTLSPSIILTLLAYVYMNLRDINYEFLLFFIYSCNFWNCGTLAINSCSISLFTQ